jgi:Tfp pilus assembly protein PilN
MKVSLNLATSPLENNRRFIAGAGVLGAFALILVVVLSVHDYHGWRANKALRGQIAQSESQIRDLDRRQQQLAAFFKTPQTSEDMQRAAFLNSLIEQRSFPWTKIFMDLEQTLPTGVRVVNISPHMENGRVEVRLVVGAITDEGKLKFLEALERSQVFSGIQVKQESRREQPGSTDRVLLELVAWYATS